MPLSPWVRKMRHRVARGRCVIGHDPCEMPTFGGPSPDPGQPGKIVHRHELRTASGTCGSSIHPRNRTADALASLALYVMFVLTQTAALQLNPQPEHFKSLIEINRNLAAGLSGRA